MEDEDKRPKEKAKTKNTHKSLHDGHRERMRQRCKISGYEGLQDHELLEMILFYVYKMGNTNERAHKMLGEYNNSVQMLLDADLNDIMLRTGIGEGPAMFFPLMKELIRRYNSKKWEKKRLVDSTDLAGRYAIELLTYKNRESFYVICLDAQNRLINSCLISEGTVSETYVYVRNVVEAALRFATRSVILAHNHLGGSINPTLSDVETTSDIVKALKMVNILVADHIIVSGQEYYSFAENGLINNE